VRIAGLRAVDLRFPLSPGAGSDARHTDPMYSFATCLLEVGGAITGTGFALTLGRGNDLVTEAIRSYAPLVVGRDLADVTGALGATVAAWSDESQLRWLGPHKGVTHLALAAVAGAIVDAWARAAGKPLWRLLLDLDVDELLSLVDFAAIGDAVPVERARELFSARRLDADAIAVMSEGYPAYDTSVGWLGYDRDTLVANAEQAVGDGFEAVKVKVGSPGLADDVSRVEAVRSVVGPDVLVMVDANQCWSPAAAVEAGRALAPFDPFWFEEPVHPDDLFGYCDVRAALTPMRIAGGEHLPNPVMFKSFIRAGAIDVVQADAVRLAGLPEFLAVALLAADAGLPVAPHAGDMGQLHQHLMPFVACALGLPVLPLETIPHVADHFAEPCRLEKGHYRLPGSPGASTAFTDDALERFAVR
jgi:L-fuconate dehydratase